MASFLFLLFLHSTVLIKYQAKEQDLGFKGIPQNSVGFDAERARELYHRDFSETRRQINEVNRYNLFFIHDPSSNWERSNSVTIWKDNKARLCIKCMSYPLFIFLFLCS